MRNLKTMLYIPGNREEFFEKVERFKPGAVIIDLEDAVPIDSKRATRDRLAELIPKLPFECWVRVNGEDEYLWDDIRKLIIPELAGFILPKAQYPEQVKEIGTYINAIEDERGIKRGKIELMLLLETALGLYNCYDLVKASPRVATVIFACAEAGDLQADLGCAWSSDGPELAYGHGKLIVDARAAGCKYVIEGPYAKIKDMEGLIEDTKRSKRMGYTGRTVIYPGHIEVCEEIYSLTAEERQHNEELIKAFDEAISKGLAAVQFKGKLLDYAMYKKAKRELGIEED